MEIGIRKARPEDVAEIAANLREGDRAEVEALGLTPMFAVDYSFRGSDHAYTGTLDGKPALIFGVGDSMFSDEASVWALGTPLCDRAPLAMVRLGRKIIGMLLEEYPVMTNYCDARYGKSIKWLKLLGFSVGEPEPYGDRKMPFCKLIIQRKEA